MAAHDEQLAAENQQRYDTLTRRIAAVDVDLGRAKDAEERQILDERRRELAAERESVAKDMVGVLLGVAATEEIMSADFRIVNAETTLRSLDGKMDKLSDQVHDVDTRQRLLEAKVEQLGRDMHQLQSQIGAVRGVPINAPKSYLTAAVVLMLVMLVMMVIITWRVL